MYKHKPLPVEGYTPQSAENVFRVNWNKMDEERILRTLDDMALETECDPRWVNIARTHIEQGFMAMNRAIFRPERISLPEDSD